jgi:oxygen-independent coproporphyrinogen-3 oxidase
MSVNELVIDPQLLARFDKPGPRYTSYPTADRFVEAFGPAAYRAALQSRRANRLARPLSLYVHLPFCNTICYYCGCNKVVTKDHGRSAKYLRYLAKEMDMVVAELGDGTTIEQLHWGGGTPTFLNALELRDLMGSIRERFVLAPDGEYSIEVDPRSGDPIIIALLGELGFNRISMGVQDFDTDVQRAVNRIQPYAMTADAVAAARGAGFKSINLDLIYGLPRQTPARFADTLRKVVDLAPNRIALYNYAHLPTVFKPQRRINEADLPSADTRMTLLTEAIETLTGAGYVYIGMDHFARPDDDLAQAQRRGNLHRNFQGYSTRAECDLVAFGVSAIGCVGASYVQNVKTLDEYYDRLDQDVFPVMRGIELKPDDMIRRAVIQALMCQFTCAIESIELAYLIDFRKYFAHELEQLRTYQDIGLVEVDDEWITITPKGRLMVRVVAMVFDYHLRSKQTTARYSKVV